MARRSHGQRKTIFATIVFCAAAGLLSAVALMSAWVARAETLPPQVYSTAVGEGRRIVLGERTTARLNTDTGLSVMSSSQLCEVALDHGETLFEMQSTSARQLRVLAGLAVVNALDSRFSVRVRDAKHVDVVVTAGQVNVNTTMIPANYLARISSGGIILRQLSDEEVLRRTEWTTGHISFSGETLTEAVAEFNRYNRRKLVIADRGISMLSIGGKFRAKDVESFIAALRPLGVRRMAGDVAIGDDAIRLVGSQGKD